MDSWPKGFRFHPTDEEIVNHYLEAKRRDKYFFVEGYIPEINMNEWEPSQIFGILWNGLGDAECCHFFAPRNLKYPNKRNSCIDRTTKLGYWKVQGSKRKVTNKGSKQVLVFYTGRPNNDTKSNWIIHEYEHEDMKDYVLCRLHQKEGESTYCQGGSSANAGHVLDEGHPRQNMDGSSRPSAIDFHNVEQNEDIWNYSSYGRNNHIFDDTDAVTKYYDV